MTLNQKRITEFVGCVEEAIRNVYSIWEMELDHEIGVRTTIGENGDGSKFNAIFYAAEIDIAPLLKAGPMDVLVDEIVRGVVESADSFQLREIYRKSPERMRRKVRTILVDGLRKTKDSGER